jgi:DNA-binding FadR family transcriptional regulator
MSKAGPKADPAVEEPAFNRITQLRAHEYVAEQIERHIALRLLGPGEGLPPERELASLFGVGRPTVQHALRILEGRSLVETRRGRYGGTFVAQPTGSTRGTTELFARIARRRKHLEDALDWRRHVEPAVAAMAAERRETRDLADMRRTMDAMADASSEPDYMRYDTEFHLAVAAAAKNEYMLRAIEESRVALSDAITLLPESTMWHGRIADEHTAVFAAIEARSAGDAQLAMEAHVANAELGLRAVLEAVRRSARAKA